MQVPWVVLCDANVLVMWLPVPLDAILHHAYCRLGMFVSGANPLFVGSPLSFTMPELTGGCLVAYCVQATGLPTCTVRAAASSSCRWQESCL
jgi:hypothetical protein